MHKKNATQAGNGQEAKFDLILPANNRQRLLQQPLIRPHLIAVGPDKRPLRSGWQQPHQHYSDGILLTAPAIGLRLGYPVLAVDFDPKPADLGQAERTFLDLTGRGSAHLPLSWTVSSGKPGRRQVLLTVNPDAAPWLKPWSQGGLEIRWRGQQSVIDGHHPETGRYQWLPRRAPWECLIAAAPSWLLEAIKPTAPQPAPYKPKPSSSCLDRWSPADWCRFYLQHWPASGLDARSEWWPTVVVMRRAGLIYEEAFAWTAASNKFNGGREFRRQWDKADCCSAPYGLEWLGARTRAARQRQGVGRG